MTCRDMSGCSVTHTLRHEGEEEQLHFPEESEEEMKEMDDEEKGKGDEREGDENEGKDGGMDDDEEKKPGVVNVVDGEPEYEEAEVVEDKEEEKKGLVDQEGREWIRVEGMKDVMILKPPAPGGGGKEEGEGGGKGEGEGVEEKRKDGRRWRSGREKGYEQYPGRIDWRRGEDGTFEWALDEGEEEEEEEEQKRRWKARMGRWKARMGRWKAKWKARMGRWKARMGRRMGRLEEEQEDPGRALNRE